MTQAEERPTRRSAFHDKWIAETRDVPASTKRALYRWSAVLAVIGITGFMTLLVLVVSEGEVAAIDGPFRDWLLSIHTDVLTSIMIWLALLFGPVVLPIVALIIVVAWGYFSKNLWRPLLLTSGMLAGLLVVQVVTRVVGRERPPLDLMLFGEDMTPSFPSGHVAGAADFMLLIAFLVFSRREKPRTAAVLYVIVGLLILVAGVSRIYLGYHWPSDALASVFLSLAVLGGVIALDTHKTVRVKDEKLLESR